NGRRIVGRHPLTDGDQVTLCDYILGFQADPHAEGGTETILKQVDARVSNADLFAENPEKKLQTILLLARHLGQALDLEKLLHNLLLLFPLAERGLVVLCERNRLVVRAQRTRRRGPADFSYSRTVIRAAIEGGRGILSEDVHADEQFVGSSTLGAVDAT